MIPGLSFHHFGLAVRDEADALSFLKLSGYTVGDKVFDPLQNVHLRLCTARDHPAVEIVMPGEGKSPVDAFLSKSSEMIYHVCYEIDDLQKTLDAIEAAGLRCLPLSERKPAVLFGGRHVSFYRVMGFGIVEFLEKA